MRNRLKKIGCYIIIIVLLPYIVTVFMNGPAIPADTAVKTTCVKVKKDDTELELPLDEYCIGRMAKEIPADYEEEALKAQAVLVRTSVYKSIKEGGTQVLLEDDFWTEEEMRQQWGDSRYSGYLSLIHISEPTRH